MSQKDNSHTIVCPHCGQDISEIIRPLAIKYMRQQAIAKARSHISQKTKEQLAAASRERLKAWREKNPEALKEKMTKASHARTKDSFSKQSMSLRATLQRKAVIFAELIAKEKQKGSVITPEIEAALLKKASSLAKKK